MGKNQDGHSMGQAERLAQAIKAVKSLDKSVVQLSAQNEHFRQLLWMVVSLNNGRVEIPEDLYRQVMKTPANEVITKLEPDAKLHKVLLINCDDEGNEMGRIIVPTGFGA